MFIFVTPDTASVGINTALAVVVLAPSIDAETLVDGALMVFTVSYFRMCRNWQTATYRRQRGFATSLAKYLYSPSDPHKSPIL
jgi:hypothetical protein